MEAAFEFGFSGGWFILSQRYTDMIHDSPNNFSFHSQLPGSIKSCDVTYTRAQIDVLLLKGTIRGLSEAEGRVASPRRFVQEDRPCARVIGCAVILAATPHHDFPLCLRVIGLCLPFLFLNN